MTRTLPALGLVAALGLSAAPSPIVARVVDAATRQPVENAIVTAGDAETRTDARGAFCIRDASVKTIRVRAHGYARAKPHR